MDMRVKDFDSYRVPNRRPWLILPALLIVVALIYFFFIRDSAEKPDSQKDSAVSSDETVASADILPEDSRVSGDNPVPANNIRAVPSGGTKSLLAEGDKLVAQDLLPEARLKYLAALDSVSSPNTRARIEKKLADIDIKMLLSPRMMPEKIDYVVKRGDSLARIAHKFGTTVDLIQKNNMLRNPNRINAGDRLRVFTGKFSMVCDKSQHDLVINMDGKFFKRYKVGTGRFGKTPVGTFVVREKIKEPPWWRPDGSVVPYGNKKENILGTRWMSLKATGDTPDVRGYGIHGTWSPESVGKDSSAGCLRMKNPEVEELFTYIPVGTHLEIVE
jgi:lipoprotein-anchoring transpeptidase ErfK/SrfK